MQHTGERNRDVKISLFSHAQRDGVADGGKFIRLIFDVRTKQSAPITSPSRLHSRSFSRFRARIRVLGVLAPVFSESDFPPALSRDPQCIIIDPKGVEGSDKPNEH